MKNYLNEALEREAKGIEGYFEYEIDKMRREVALTEGTSHYYANLAHFNRLVRIKWEVLARVARMQGLSKGYIEGLLNTRYEEVRNDEQ